VIIVNITILAQLMIEF